ncbi:hypothetical protein OG320_23450 [Microbispora sp. NBC_01189]|nr:hypothetical protein OG320_23450 [Microbispora sp. NBC_01189]
MSVPLWNVGGDLLGGRPGHLRDRDGVGKGGPAPWVEAGHGRSIAA